MLLIHMKV